MNKVQVSSGRSSSATHRLTQASTTLNRRYVRRPANIAIEEAARAASVPHSENSPSIARPSRLVNLGVSAADLEAAREQQLATPSPVVDETPVSQPVAMYPHVIELGGIDPMTTPIEQAAAPEPSIPTEPIQSNPVIPVEPAVTPEVYPEIQPRIQEPVSSQPEIDTNELAMNIAADYAAASLGASMKEYGDNYNNYAMSDPSTSVPTPIEPVNSAPIPDSVDAIAQAASEAIAAIRTATEPSEVSEQVASLKAFADNIKSNHNTPEMRELSDTIDKFVSIAMKSGKIQPETLKKTASSSTAKPTKVALSSKATRAAAKVTKTSAKVMAKNRTKAMPATTTGRIAKKTMSRSSAMARPVKRLSSAELKERAIEQALESVATMNESTPKAKRHQPTMRAKRKGGVKRFIIAFTCAAICVGGVIAFVGSNIPDISVRVAAMQTGITATYPSYVPRDYKLGDVFSESGKITMVFDGPAGASFTLEEEKSSWDSSALLRNFVEVNWGEGYATTHEQGVTIYIAENTSDAVWVNGGVLYKITSSGTPLTKKQVRSIVTSL